jgi:type II secretory ATPase GspE/PulE/Tfp pilus assembly ATPase PilB-like protein
MQIAKGSVIFVLGKHNELDVPSLSRGPAMNTLPFVEPNGVDFDAFVPIPSVLEAECARLYRVIPTEAAGRPYLVLVTDAEPPEKAYWELRFLLKKEIAFCKVDTRLFSALAQKTWPGSHDHFPPSRNTDEFKAKVIMERQGTRDETGCKPFLLQQHTEPTISIVDVVDDIFSKAIQAGASDIHLEPVDNEVKVRLRLDGVLQQIMSIPKTRQNEIVSRLKILARMDIAEKRRPQDGRILVEGKNKTVDVRVSSMPTAAGEKVVLRLLDKSAQPLDLLSLGLQGANYDLFCASIRKPCGAPGDSFRRYQYLNGRGSGRIPDFRHQSDAIQSGYRLHFRDSRQDLPATGSRRHHDR